MAKGTFAGSVTSERIGNQEVGTADIENNAVIASKILDDTITGAKLADDIDITTTGTLNVSGGTLTTSSAQKQTIVQAGPGSGTFDVSAGTLTTSTAQKQTIVQAGPGNGTLDVSAGTLTTSTAQKDAIVDGSTAITRSSNDLTFAGDITVTGGDIKSSGGTTAISISGSNTTLSGTTNNIGTVTAGTISHTVSMTGVPRRTTVHKISQSSYRGTYSAETTQRVTHTSVSFPVLNGYTYLIQVNGLANVELSSSSSFDRGGKIRLYYHTASKSRGNSSAFGTLLQTIHIGQINDNATSGELNGEPFHMIGAFTASSDTTMYTHLTAQSSATYHEVEIDSSGGNQEFGGELYFVIQEFDSDVLT